MRRIVFINDASRAFIDFQRDRVLEEWEVEKANLKTIERISEAGISSLFGAAPTALLQLTDKSQLSPLVEAIEKLSDATIEAIGESGLLITADIDKRSTGKLGKAVEAMGGRVISVASKGAAKAIIDTLHLNRSAKEFMEDYAGDDYSSIVGVAAALSKLSPEQQAKVTAEDILLRIPTPPGSVPPWELEKPLMAGNVTDTVKLFRRIVAVQHLLIPLAVLKNKFVLAWRTSAVLQEDPGATTDKIAVILGVPDNYPLKLALQSAKKYGHSKLDKVIKLVAKTEAQVKGGSATSASTNMEIMLVSIINTLKG